MPKNKLSVDMDTLQLAFEDTAYDNSYFLDIETGKVHTIARLDGNFESQIDQYIADDRYLQVPNGDAQDGYGDMQQFIGTVADPHLREKLDMAVADSGGFKTVLLNYPQERERWSAFKEQQLRQRILDWLGEEEIEPM